jgi:hypothetical protein
MYLNGMGFKQCELDLTVPGLAVLDKQDYNKGELSN